MNEGGIRDWLTNNLEQLEPGLKVVSKEFKLKNSVGTKGFIDILARDRFGLFVVIEIKKTNQTARQAVHELFKYAGLLKRERGLNESQIRCILASVEWTELEIPFAEYASKVPYSALGFNIEIDASGSPTGVSPHELLKIEDSDQAFPCHLAFLFESRTKRDAFPDLVIPSTIEAGFTSGAIVCLECVEGNAKGEFAAYWAPFAFDSEVRSRVEAEMREEYEYDEDYEIELSSLLDHAQAPITEACYQYADGLEIGYPDKFRTILAKWKIESVIRIGTLSEEPFLLTNEDIVEHLKGRGSSHSILFKDHSSPRLKGAWAKTKANASAVLFGNLRWGECFDWICKSLEREYPDSDIHFHIFNPQYLPLTLYKVASEGTPYLPCFVVMVIKGDGSQSPLAVYQGVLTWDGKTHPNGIEETLAEMFEGDPFGWFITYHFAESWQYEEELCQIHGLSYEVTRWDFSEGKDAKGDWVKVSNGTASFQPVNESEIRPLPEFFDQNHPYLNSLFEFFEKYSKGL